MFLQSVVANLMAILGILLSISGYPNIYAASEFSGPFAKNQWAHVAGHLTIGMIVPTLLGWGVASIAMLVTRKLGGRPAAA